MTQVSYSNGPSPQMLGGAMMPMQAAQNAAPPQMGNPMGGIPQMTPAMMQAIAANQSQNNTGSYSPGPFGGLPPTGSAMGDQMGQAMMDPNASAATGAGLTNQFGAGLMGLQPPSLYGGQ